MGRYRIGVGIGGTFTDFSVHDAVTGQLHSYKTPTVLSAPVRGVAEGLSALHDLIGLQLGELDYFVHGTTIGVNAILQRIGAPTALLVTQGFRDILELQRLRLPNPFDFYTKRPKPLVPRRHVYEIPERTRSNGRIDTPLDEAIVRTAIEAVRAEELSGIAVCLINAYRNPAHEQRIKQLLAEQAPELFVNGLVTREIAETVYGVVFQGMEVAPEATACRRAELATGPARSSFDLGIARAAYEAQWIAEASAALQHRLMGVAPSIRSYAKRIVHQQLADTAVIHAEDIERVWLAIQQELGTTWRRGEEVGSPAGWEHIHRSDR